ncbi:SHD1 domain-containing protein [Prosthecobacter sp.]|uniref:SHD1 domain-containing protein n=1 Tax=Prosthecobacter sp. TaxID=1965333 RepID=UPI0037840D9C
MRIHPPRLLLKSLSVLCIGMAGVPLPAAERVWKDAGGQHEIRAELVSQKGGVVLLKRENGLIITVPLATLSREDQEFLAAGRPPEAAAPREFVLSGDLEEIRIEFPKPMFIGTPLVDFPNMEKFDPSKRITRFMALKGTVNVAKGKKVTSSDAAPIIGELALVTDGDADGADGSFVELMPGKQWVQIDLGATHTLQKMAVWHYHKQAGAYLDVIIQASNDPEFKQGVTTLWNSDHDDSSNMGKGKDPTYVETSFGRIIEGKGAKARYVRLWSNGNTNNDMNHYCEVQVFAVPEQKAAK